MEFKKKLLSGLSAVVLIVVAQGIFGVWRTENIQQHLLKSHKVSLREAEAAMEMLQTLADFKALLAEAGGMDAAQWSARRAAGDALIENLKQLLVRGMEEAQAGEVVARDSRNVAMEQSDRTELALLREINAKVARLENDWGRFCRLMAGDPAEARPVGRELMAFIDKDFLPPLAWYRNASAMEIEGQAQIAARAIQDTTQTMVLMSIGAILAVIALGYYLFLTFLRALDAASARGRRDQARAGSIEETFVRLRAALEHAPDDAGEGTMRKRWEELERFFTASLDLLCTADLSGRFVRVNPAFEHALGYSREELTKRPFAEFIHPEDRTATEEQMRGLREGRSLLHFENRYRCKDGSLRHLSWKAVPVAEAGLIYASARDVTELREAERPLREHEEEIVRLNAGLERRIAERTAELASSEEQFRLAMEYSPVGMALVSPEGRWLRVNDAISKILGYSPRELQATSFQAITHPDDLAADLRRVQRMLSGEISTYQMEKRYLRKDGRTVWALLSVSLVRDERGQPRYFISQILDITPRKESEERMRAALENEKELVRKAQAGEHAKSEFLAVMSHEIRTPMNGILGFSELLLKTLETSPEAREYAQTIFHSGEALLRILDDILDFSRLEASRLRIEEEAFSPRQLVGEIRSLLLPNATVKGLRLETRIAGELAEFYLGDGGRLRQILLNLAGNAIKFTDRGAVAITVACRERGAGRSVVEFSVRDEGRGISADRLDQIFEPFVQLDSGSSRRFGGTGLGLSISRRLARLMGGEISVRSEEGRGTEFRVEIPLRPCDGRRPETERSEAGPEEGTEFARAHPLRVLVAEDDRVSLKLIVTVLRKLGYEPLQAQSGRAAVDICRREHPDCLLLDLQMPDLDGAGACRDIRRLEAERGWRPAYVAILTANTVPADRERCFGAGANAYLNKPVIRDRLIQILRAASRGDG